MPRELTRRRRPATDASKYAAPAKDEDEQDAEEPTRRRPTRRSSKAEEPEKETRPKREVSKGWEGLSKEKEGLSDFAEKFVVTEEQSLFKFLDDEPFAVYKMHWIERTGKKSWNCLGDTCPICELTGDKPRLQAIFNVIDLMEDKPKVVIWTVGIQLVDQFKNFAKQDNTSPINREDLYWSVSKSGGGSKGRVTYSVIPVKERDLEDDWDIQPLSSDELDALFEESYDDSEVQLNTKKELSDIAREMI